jgi:methyltransferase (TIGR00027 family)
MSPIQSISDTAHLTALYRAFETERPDALFHDPYARLLAGERGIQALHAMREDRFRTKIHAVRPFLIDQYVQRLVKQEEVDVVLNLGAGLDTRPYRLLLPSTCKWIEADFPEVLAYKQNKLQGVKPMCTLESIGLDLWDAPSRQKLIEYVSSQAKQVLTITEGLLIYLSPEQVATLASEMHQQKPFCWWVTELASPQILRAIQKHEGKPMAQAGIKQQFAPEDGSNFFHHYGWETVEQRSMLDEGQRLSRGVFPNWLWKLLGYVIPHQYWEGYRKSANMVLMKRIDVTNAHPTQ